ncbi:MAG: hypothetical protein PWP40_113 [Rhodocyclaceae bacterium]|nr:hypothetical protein [Rhodocyclaceae bacterium]
MLSALLTAGVMVPVLILSYAALHSLMTGKIEADLRESATVVRFAFETRLDALVDKIASASKQTIFSNALSDSGERSRYIQPILQDICDASPAITTLVLTDFRGQLLEQGSDREQRWRAEQGQQLQRIIEEGHVTLTPASPDHALHLSLAAPIAFLPTGSFEGALVADLDLEGVFAAATKAVDGRYAVRLKRTDASAGAGSGAAGEHDELAHLAPLSAVAGSNLPLAIEVAMDRQLANRPIYWLMAAFLAIGVGIFALVAWQSRRLALIIAEPLSELEHTAARVAAGELDALPAVTEIPGDGDRFRLLTATVYRMIAALRDTQRQLAATLEARTSEVAHSERERMLKEQALASTESGVLILRQVDDGQRVHYANSAFLHITGFAAAEVVGALWPAEVFPGSAGTAIEAERGFGEPILLTHRRADDSEAFIEISISPMTVDDAEQVPHAIVLVTDVTRRHETSLAIALRDRALQAVQNGIVITDLQQPDNPIIYVNRAFEDITGYSFAEVAGRNPRLLHRDDRDQPELAQLDEAVAARQACAVTLRNYRKDGALYWNELSISPLVNPLSGEVTHYVGVQSDITERRRTEDLLLEWLSRFDAVFTLSPDPLVCFDKDGRLSYVNAAAERIFGTSIGALTGITIAEFGAHVSGLLENGHGLLRLPDPAPDAARSGDDLAQDSLLRIVRPKPCMLRQTYRYCGASSASLVLYYRDVTREAELDRMKSEFLNTAAHELRTPMSSIMGFSELLMMRRYDEDKTRELLATINRQAHRLTDLLTDLLDLARIEARRAESFRFDDVPLRQAIDEALAAFLIPDDTHRLVLELPPELPTIRMDRAKFQQALLNLLSNACKFSPGGGDIELAVHTEHPEGLGFIGVAVRDHGLGMNAEDCSHAFERFYRSDRSGHIPGTGLGLPLVKEIMTVHGGSVTLESVPDVGTCVTLWFPLAPAHVEDMRTAHHDTQITPST